MKFDKSTGNIITSKGDFGSGLHFEVNGAETGDKIVFCFSNVNGAKPADKVYTLDSNFAFDFDFSKQEAKALSQSAYTANIPYSVKHYRDGVLLSTLIDAQLIVKGTVMMNGE